MAVPTRRTGKTKKRIRRGPSKLTATNYVTCSNCGASIEPHKVCPNCGFYNGKKVMDVKSSEK